MGQQGGGETLRKYLKLQNLFVRDINRDVGPSVVKAALEKLCPPTLPGTKVVLPIDFSHANQHIGQAYLNFGSHEDAKRCLEKNRFALSFKGVPAKVMYAAVDKDAVFGPYSLKFQIIVKNLSEEVEVSALFEFFSKFGEIYQCKTDRDLYDQYFGQVTFMDTDSVELAVHSANQTRWAGSVIVVEPHHKAHLAHSHKAPPSPLEALASVSSAGASPAVAAGSGGGAATSSAAAAQHQQQQHQQHQQSPAAGQSLFSGTGAAANFALAASSGGGGATPSQQQQQTAAATAGLSGGGAGGGMYSTYDVPVAIPYVPPGASAPLAARGDGGVQLQLGGLQLGPQQPVLAATNAAAPAAPAAGASLAARLGTNHLLQLLDRHHGGGSSSPLAPSGSRRAAAPAVATTVPAAPAAGRRAAAGASSAGAGAPKGMLRSVVGLLEQVSEVLCCPITHEVFVDPVVAADGITYERAAISSWLERQSTSPMTNLPMPNRELHANSLVKTLVELLL